jgi:hypothetical protein
MPKDRPISRDEIKGALTLILLFISVVGGREIGNYYASYREMTRLKVLFEVTEEEISRYILDVAQGEDTDLEIGLIITALGANNSAGIVTDTPEYVNRWLIGLTVSPIVVNQPEASDVELEMLIEDDVVDEALYSFPKQKISFIRFTDRSMRLDIEDIDEFTGIVDEASLEYGGEIKVTFRGQVHMHLLFLDTWLPFTVTRYPIVKAPHLEYVESGWRSYTDGQVSSLTVGEGGYVLVEFSNPTRLHSLREDVTCRIYRDGEFLPVLNITKNVQMPPGTEGQYIFLFTLMEPGNYTYNIVSDDKLLTDSSLVLSVE